MSSFGSPDSYRVQLEAYAGPLDLLLYLVKRHEIDLHDIPIAQLTEQYLEHLKVIEAIDVEKAGEFLVMAATLLEIKSQVLMPRERDEDDAAADADTEADAGDPRKELVQQLLAYKRYKDAAAALERRQEQWWQRYAAHATQGKPEEPEDAPAKELDLEDVNVMDLCEAFARMLDSIGQANEHQVTYDDTPISLHAEDIYDRLEREGPLSLQRIFEGRSGRSEMIGLFLATLELVRDRKVAVLQDRIAGEITLEVAPEDQRQAADDADDESRDWRDPETGEVQYDWPDEEARKRAERRARLRARRAGDDAASSADDDDAEGEPFAEDEPDADGDEQWWDDDLDEDFPADDPDDPDEGRG